MVPRAGSDIDIAASFDPLVPAAFEVDVPAGIDLLILNTAPLEICGRIALHGQQGYLSEEVATTMTRLADLRDLQAFIVQASAWLAPAPDVRAD